VFYKKYKMKNIFNKIKEYSGAILFISYLIFVIYQQYKPPKTWPIEDTINYKLSGKVKVIGSLHGTWFQGFYISLQNMKPLIKINDDANKSGDFVKYSNVHQNNIWFSNVVKDGDSIFKEKGSDSVYLYRNGKLIYKCKLRQ